MLLVAGNPHSKPSRYRASRSPEATTTGEAGNPASKERADARTRTGDPFITSEVLYQLSYVGGAFTVAGLRRNERVPEGASVTPSRQDLEDHRKA
jgi:hypothetical protein